jgi:GNAT superfamily N-acetyltransferase
MDIRVATPDDVPGIITVGTRTWPTTYDFAGTDYIAHGLATWWSPEAVTRSLHTTTVLVADDHGTLTGTGNIDLRGPVPTIWKLYVLPEAQGAGTGAALLKALLAYAGDRPVQLEYTDGNLRAARFYAAHGFRETHRTPPTTPGWPDTVWLQRHP